jgi:hypothetical protein
MQRRMLHRQQRWQQRLNRRRRKRLHPELA